MRGSTVIIYLLLSVAVSSSLILKSFQEQFKLNTAFAFSLLYIMSLVPLVLLAAKGSEPIPWLGDLDNLRELQYVLLGFVGVVGSAVVFTSYLNVGYLGAYLAAIASGVILFYVQIKTGSILAPIIVHAFYNSFVLIQPMLFTLIPTSPIFVPTFSEISGLTYSDVIWQFTFVAPAEEMLKTALASGIMLQTTYPQLRRREVALGVAIVVWSLLHAFQAY